MSIIFAGSVRACSHAMTSSLSARVMKFLQVDMVNAPTSQLNEICAFACMSHTKRSLFKCYGGNEIGFNSYGEHKIQNVYVEKVAVYSIFICICVCTYMPREA